MYHCKTIESAEKHLKEKAYDKYDKKPNAKLICDPRLIDLIRDDIIDPVISRSATKLSVLIKYRNIAYTTTDEIAETLGVSKKHIAGKLKELDGEGLIVAIAPKGANKPERNLIFNPTLFWRGSSAVKTIRDDEIILHGKEWRNMSQLPEFDPIKQEYI